MKLHPYVTDDDRRVRKCKDLRRHPLLEIKLHVGGTLNAVDANLSFYRSSQAFRGSLATDLDIAMNVASPASSKLDLTYVFLELTTV